MNEHETAKSIVEEITDFYKEENKTLVTITVQTLLSVGLPAEHVKEWVGDIIRAIKDEYGD